MTFIEQVAADIFANYQHQLQNVVVVFPNQRTGLFFRKALHKVAKKTTWMPKMYGITEFMKLHSTFKKIDNISVNAKLYRIFMKYSRRQESFDQFYSWGEMLLEDFNEIDRQMVNPREIFQLIENIQSIDQAFSFLTNDQIQAIKSFWESFMPPDFSDEQNNFREVWQILSDVYFDLQDELLAENLAYEGMYFRQCAESLLQDKWPFPEDVKVCFIGFNALTRSEETVFDVFRKRGQARYYWDYDKYYIEDKNQEAGLFIRKYISKYPSSVPPSEQIQKNTTQITEIGIPQSIGQTKSVAQFFQKEYAENAAILLPDQVLLMPLLNTLPSEVEKNVTMGYPVRQSITFALLKNICEMHRHLKKSPNGEYLLHFKVYKEILKNPHLQSKANTWIEQFIEKCEKNRTYFPYEDDLKDAPSAIQHLFKFSTEDDGLVLVEKCISIFSFILEKEELEDVHTKEIWEDEMYRQLLFYVKVELEKLRESMLQNTIPLQLDTASKIIRQHISRLNIPFESDVTQGVQILGFLESRNLDFENVFVLNMNEDMVPTNNYRSSFIPYHLRRGFGLFTSEDQEAQAAYYFYRLLHKAKNLFLLYDTEPGALGGGEKSRFLLQLESETNYPIKRYQQTQTIQLEEKDNIIIPKTEAILSEIERMSSGEYALSPSALNVYLDCSLKYYYKHIAKIDEKREMSSALDHVEFGNILHHTVEALYKKNQERNGRKVVNIEDFDAIEKDLQSCIIEAFRETFKLKEHQQIHLTGHTLIAYNVVEDYVKRVLEADKLYAPFTIEHLEEKITGTIQVDGKKLNLGGFVDRLDMKNGIYRIIDYKTGAFDKKKNFKNIAELFDLKNRKDYIFQVILYSILFQNSLNDSQASVQPQLLFVREKDKEMSNPILMDKVPLTNISEIKEEFLENLKNTLSGLISPHVPFSQTDDKDKCAYCYYNTICRKV